MPALKELNITYEQIVELVCQLEFEKQLALLQMLLHAQGYRKNFYRYTEALREQYHIPAMNEESLDQFLHTADARL